MPKNVQTIIQLCSLHMLAMLCSPHMLATLCSKSFKLGFSSMWTENVQIYKLGFEELEEPEIKLPISFGSWRKQRSSRKSSTSVLLTMLKPLTVWITRNYGKFLKRWKHQTTVCVSWETCNSYNQTWNNQLVQNWERSTTSILSLCLFNSMQSTSAFLTSMLGWRKLKLESRL